MWRHLLLIVSLCVGWSFQLRECELSSAGNRDLSNDTTDVMVAEDACPEGFISWHYPRGMLPVRFPRSIAGDELGRKPIRVCLTAGIGDGVTGVQQVITTRRGKVRTHKIDLGTEGDAEICSRPSRSPNGVTIQFRADGEAYYLQVINYKVESVEWKGRRRNGNKKVGQRGGRKQGGRRGGKRGQKGGKKGNRRPGIKGNNERQGETVEAVAEVRGVSAFKGRPKYQDN